jgi:cyclic beta-1,2-glucan synthetase
VAVESILGFERRSDSLRIDPCVPRWWPGFTIRYRHGNTFYRIEVTNPDGISQGVKSVEVDGLRLEDGRIALADDGREHSVLVRLGAKG